MGGTIMLLVVLLLLLLLLSLLPFSISSPLRSAEAEAAAATARIEWLIAGWIKAELTGTEGVAAACKEVAITSLYVAAAAAAAAAVAVVVMVEGAPTGTIIVEFIDGCTKEELTGTVTTQGVAAAGKVVAITAPGTAVAVLVVVLVVVEASGKGALVGFSATCTIILFCSPSIIITPSFTYV